MDETDTLMKPLQEAGLKVQSVRKEEIQDFNGKLLLISTTEKNREEQDRTLRKLQKLKDKDVGILWFKPRLVSLELEPSFRSEPSGTNCFVVADPKLVSEFSTNPESQLRLVQLCRHALKNPLTKNPNSL